MQASAFVPLLLVTAAILLCVKKRTSTPWVDRFVVFGLAFLVLRYLHWRFFVTVLPVEGFTATSVFVWTLFIVELLAWIDTAVLHAYMLRRTDRTPEADWHEVRLRSLPASDLPNVDVFIATFNEPADVLEKTIVGALAMDWPEERRTVWVLDDGRRVWLKDLAEQLGASYLTREGNADAKAGNINAAVARTSAPFFLVLDADFIPQREFLFRAMGFFEDPKIGIVQIPHYFFNPDPMQSATNMSRVMPDDQRFFFEVIMPGRDGYDCAFCCGSNGIVRRAALETIGNRLPSGSITEDMLLTIALKRKGYITRYLCERLAFGLAPEDINAFFIQRSRWARGGIQILFLKEGPLGRAGLKMHERMFFLPLHWISQSFGQSLAMVTPAIFLLTGILPMVNTTAGTVFSYQLPAIVAAIAAVNYFARGQYNVIATTAHCVLQAFRLLPVVVATLVRPHGHAFRVTPKEGSGASVQDTGTVTICLTLCLLMGLGLYLNSDFDLRIVPFSHLLPVVAFWAVFNSVLLLMVAKIAITPPLPRHEQRFDMDEDVTLCRPDGTIAAKSKDMSLTGALVVLPEEETARLHLGDWVALGVAEVGRIPARVSRTFGEDAGGTAIGLEFQLPTSCLPSLDERPGSARNARPAVQTGAAKADSDWFEISAQVRLRLIRKLFTRDRVRRFDTAHGWSVSYGMMRSILSSERHASRPGGTRGKHGWRTMPRWLEAYVREGSEAAAGSSAA